MNTLHSIPLRFGDPVTSIATNFTCVAYGTAFGKVEVFNTQNQEFFQITEISEEYVGSISLSSTNTLTFTVGDYYSKQIEYPYSTGKALNQAYSRIHTIEDCSNSITFIFGQKICLVPTNGMNIYILCIPEQSCKLQNPLPPHSIPIDYYDDKILIEHYSLTGSRTLSHFYYEKGVSEIILQIDEKFHLTSTKLFSSGLVFIKDYSSIYLYNYSSDFFEVPFESQAEIIAFGICELEQDLWAGVVDCEGKVTILKNWSIYQTGEILCKGLQVKDFDKGYPYFLAIYPPSITISSDHFVHILNFSI